MIVMVVMCPKPKCGGRMRLSGWDRKRGDSYVCERCRYHAYYPMVNDCIYKSPDGWLVVDKDGMKKQGIGCTRVWISDLLHPECVELGCSELEDK